MSQKQYFVIAGLDFSALPSASSSQIIQAINQLEPLDNIGFIVAQNTTPDTATNPEFERFVWLDTSTIPPVPKVYNITLDTWANAPIGAGAITTAMMTAASATGGISIDLLKRIASGAADVSKAGYVVTLDVNGQYCTISDLSAALATISGGIGLTNLSVVGGANGYILGWDGAKLAYVKVTPATYFTAALATLIPITCLSPSIAKYIARTNAAANAVEWVASNDDSLFAAGDITLDKLGKDIINGTAPTALQTIRQNAANTAKEWATPIYSKECPDATHTGLAGATLPATGSLQTIAHGLGQIPKEWRVVLKNTSGGVSNGYAANTELPIEFVRDSNAMSVMAIGAFASDTVSIVVQYIYGTDLRVFNVTATGTVALTLANWTAKVYAKA